MKYTTIYEFHPESISHTDLLISIILLVIGLVGLIYFSKNNFRNDAYLFQIPFSQKTTQKIIIFFMTFIVLFGLIGLIAYGYQIKTIPTELKKIETYIEHKNLQTIETRQNPFKQKIEGEIRFDERIEINGVEFSYPELLQLPGTNQFDHELIKQIDSKQNLRISYVELLHEKVIVKIEKKTTNANTGV